MSLALFEHRCFSQCPFYVQNLCFARCSFYRVLAASICIPRGVCAPIGRCLMTALRQKRSFLNRSGRETAIPGAPSGVQANQSISGPGAAFRRPLATEQRPCARAERTPKLHRPARRGRRTTDDSDARRACTPPTRRRDRSQRCFTIGQALSLSGRAAFSAGTVARSLR